jgi:rhodanese-related sulfurtransferase
MGNPLSAQDLLDVARRRITRHRVTQAHEAQSQGTIVVDLRCDADRTAEGAIPGAISVAHTGDIEGGFRAWAAAGLPVETDS